MAPFLRGLYAAGRILYKKFARIKLRYFFWPSVGNTLHWPIHYLTVRMKFDGIYQPRLIGPLLVASVVVVWYYIVSLMLVEGLL